jgi:hypothetical protein
MIKIKDKTIEAIEKRRIKYILIKTTLNNTAKKRLFVGSKSKL